uniref:ribosomal protein L19 n=1 Tax=Bangia fuscopurpurea TaxID=101920 RepID=UPI002A83D883|nr:ribosomal protein L19 [Bangia fuscopurpurea]WOJ51955.1 ribosomal protein L19 [Bangia fuscopurpurea]
MKENSLKLNQLMTSVETSLMKPKLPEIKVGDTIQLGLMVREGSKTREQLCEGVVLSRKKRKSLNTSLTLRCSFQGIGVERVFFLHSPRVTFIKVIRRAKVRRAKLYYLRDLLGKAGRLKQIFN